MPPSHGRILIVDDAPRVALREYLATQGYTVDTAVNGADALTAVRRERPDLVLLDVCMPDMDGVAVRRRLHEIAVEVPVIMITADVELAVALTTLSLGRPFACVANPCDLDDLGRVMEAARLHTRGPSISTP